MIRHPIDLTFTAIDDAPARAAVSSHHAGLAFPGDNFLPEQQLQGQAHTIMINNDPVGVVVINDRTLVLCTLSRATRRHGRQVLERVLQTFELDAAFAASWDPHHVALFGAFAAEVTSQAYQFQLLEPAHLKPAARTQDRPDDHASAVTLTTATEADLPYLSGAGFLDDYTSWLADRRVRIAHRDDRTVGIGLAIPHQLHPSLTDLGMFTEEDVRRQGVGSSIIAELARECLERGQTPVAGCWAGNWNSRPTLEAAGLTCIGTIFRLTLDPDRFA